MRERSEAFADQKFVEKSKKSKRLRSLSETLDDQTIDKYLDQYLSGLGGGSDDDNNNERKQKVKAATIMDLLADDLMEHLSGDDEPLKKDDISKKDASKSDKTSDSKKSDNVNVKDEL